MVKKASRNDAAYFFNTGKENKFIKTPPNYSIRRCFKILLVNGENFAVSPYYKNKFRQNRGREPRF